MVKKHASAPHGSKTIFHTLDAVRGALAILIVTRHAAPMLKPISFPGAYLAVDVFFLLSGIVICQAYEDKLKSEMSPWQFAYVRLVRIYPLCLLGFALGILDLVLNGNPYFAAKWWPSVILFAALMLPNVFMPTGPFPLDGPTWSLTYELAANFVYGFVARVLQTWHLVAIVGVSAVILAGTLYLRNDHSMDFGYRLSAVPSVFFRVATSFFLGVLLFRFYASRPRTVQKNALGTTVSLSVVAIIVSLLALDPSPALRPFFDFFCVALVFPSLIFLSLFFQPVGMAVPVCRFLGMTSYAVYCLHVPLSELVTRGATRDGTSVLPSAPWSGLLFLAALLSVCLLLDKVYDFPLRKALLRWAHLRRTSSVGANDPTLSVNEK